MIYTFTCSCGKETIVETDQVRFDPPRCRNCLKEMVNKNHVEKKKRGRKKIISHAT